ncbi:hypothetical protein C2W62_25095 [Candidatus Entotheonella serta]|nr:hypothetical protein C2W62_25095 [Candidatus Entotheonella serta]
MVVVRVLLLLAVLPLPTLAQHGAWCACGEHEVLPVQVEIDHSATWRWAAVREFDKWNMYGDLFQWSQGDGRAGINGKHEVIFFTPSQALDIYGIVMDSDTYGITYVTPLSVFGSPPFDACPPPAGTTCGVFTETDVIINSAFVNGWKTSAPTYDDTGPTYYGAALLHEVGHMLGLHHNFDNLSAMNDYEDFAAIYISHSDSRAVRGHYPEAATIIPDVGTYPFRFAGFQHHGTTMASVAPTTVQAGGTFTLANITIENVGSEVLDEVELRIYLSVNENITTSDYLVGTLIWSSLSTWWDTTGRQFTVPASVPPGTDYVGALVTHNSGTPDDVVYNNRWVLDTANRLTVVR